MVKMTLGCTCSFNPGDIVITTDDGHSTKKGLHVSMVICHVDIVLEGVSLTWLTTQVDASEQPSIIKLSAPAGHVYWNAACQLNRTRVGG